MHQQGEIRRRKHDGFAHGEKFGELRREAVVVERPGASGLQEHIREGEEARQPGLVDKTEVEHVLAVVEREAGKKLR